MPARTSRRLPRFETLFERVASRAPFALTPPLRRLYDGDLRFSLPRERPYVVANFVETLDGVVSFAIPGQSGGGEISGFDVADQFLMGLLRARADAVMVGAGTLHADSGHVRTPSFVFPAAAPLFSQLRRRAGMPPEPLNVIVTASGRVDLGEPTFHIENLESVIVTTAKGRRRLQADHGRALEATRVRVVGESGDVKARAVLALLWREFGVRLLLHEGGPQLLATFLAEGCLDELFLTVAPQAAGRRADSARPSFVEGVAFTPRSAPWFRLLSAKRAASDHVYLRFAPTAALSGRAIRRT
jgi:riboflavin biosynthesis pyrimidine reductase